MTVGIRPIRILAGHIGDESSDLCPGPGKSSRQSICVVVHSAVAAEIIYDGDLFPRPGHSLNCSKLYFHCFP